MLTYRENRDGSLVAAYLGACRVGYLERSVARDSWRWCTNLVRPEGGVATGIAPDRARAEEALAEAVSAWLDAASVAFVAAPGQS